LLFILNISIILLIFNCYYYLLFNHVIVAIILTNLFRMQWRIVQLAFQKEKFSQSTPWGLSLTSTTHTKNRMTFLSLSFTFFHFLSLSFTFFHFLSLSFTFAFSLSLFPFAFPFAFFSLSLFPFRFFPFAFSLSLFHFRFFTFAFSLSLFHPFYFLSFLLTIKF
jgi:hypothetical protein